jgi:phosphoglycerate dehydrogenase-like enzyme
VAEVVASLGRFGDGLMALVAQATTGEHFVSAASDAPTDADVLVALLDPEYSDELERALRLPSVRWVHVLAAGVDRFPFVLVGDRAMTCSRGASAPAIAEFVLATMLAFEKQLPDAWITEVPANWNLAALGGLAGKTLGLVGVGAIGLEVARRALAFDMRVVAVRRTDAPFALPDIARAGSLPELLGIADHVVVAAPATPTTRHMLDADAFAAIKPGAHLVNIARGSLIDQDALRAALDSGRVARASLDVVEPEPLPEGHWLYTHPRVRLSPHVAWSAPGTIERTIELFVDNLRRWREGRPLHGAVDTAAGY